MRSHREKCRRQRAQSRFVVADKPAIGEELEIYCNATIKPGKEFCRQLKYICPNHCKPSSTAICLRPKNLDKFLAALTENQDLPEADKTPTGCCPSKVISCSAHRNWDARLKAEFCMKKLTTIEKFEVMRTMRVELMKRKKARYDVMFVIEKFSTKVVLTPE